MSYAAYGTLIKRGDGAATEVFTTVLKVRDIGGPAYSVDIVDVTANDSSGGWEEVAPTILRTGDFTFNAVRNDRSTSHSTAGIRGDMIAKRKVNWRVYSPPSTATSGFDKLAFAGYLTGMSQTDPMGDAKQLDVTIKPTGTPTWTTTATATS